MWGHSSFHLLRECSCPGRWPGPMQVSRSWGKPHLVHITLSMWNFSFENILLICFWLRWVFIAMSRFSLVVASEGLLFIAVCRLPIAVASLVENIGVVESSWTRDQTHALCFGKQILKHWTTREVPMQVFSNGSWGNEGGDSLLNDLNF